MLAHQIELGNLDVNLPSRSCGFSSTNLLKPENENVLIFGLTPYFAAFCNNLSYLMLKYS